MTQTALTSFESTEDTTTHDRDAGNENEADDADGLRVEVIATGRSNNYNDNIDALTGATHINDADAYRIPRHETRADGFADLAAPKEDPVEFEHENGVETRVHALPVTVGAHADPINDRIGEIIRDAAREGFDDVVCVELAHLGRDTAEIADRVATLIYSGTYIVTSELKLNPDEHDAGSVRDLIRAIGSSGYSIIPTPDDAGELVNDADSHTGRPPLGFEYSDGGELQISDDYHRICRELTKCMRGEQSQRSTASELDCAARTVKRCIEQHPDRYQL